VFPGIIEDGMAELLLKDNSTDQQVTWHKYAVHSLLEALETTSSGLSNEDAANRQAQYGKNILPGRKSLHPLAIFLHQFKNPLIYILLVASVISLAIGDAKDAFFILVVILLNAIIGTFQEWKAEKGVAALQKLLKTYAQVRRSDTETRIDAEELVPGDLIYLESGSRVPADIRILEANNLYADESLLTGESIVVHKTERVLPDEPLPVAEQDNMLFAGTTVTSGRAKGIVVTTGLSTELGKIAQAVSDSEATKTPLVNRMESFSRRIGYLVLASCAVLSVVAVWKGLALREVFFMAVALAVSAIPEGLPVAMTVALSVATSRMAKRKVLIRKLMAVEGLGSCTVIATDKTGTLTLNRQTVRMVSMAGKQYRVSGEGYVGEGEITSPDGNPLQETERYLLQELSKAAVLCNEACLYKNSDGQWQSAGDPVDIALMALAYKTGVEPVSVWKSIEVLEKIPYESERMYAALFYRSQHQVMIAIKGAAEILLPRCQTQLTTEGEQPLDLTAIEGELRELTSQGYRVLAIAQGNVPEYPRSSHSDLPNLTLLGFVALIDPLRPEAKAAIQQCKQAGIRVAMITGDHPSTALTIGRELGIANTQDDLMTGEQLGHLEQAPRPVLIQALQNASVFARVAPLQKLRIVETLKEARHYVAVTGDGVNDAPALKTANIGVAMGSGTDVAKDAASIIITDDNFASIVGGIEEGRFAYDNIRKVIYLLVSTGAAEVILFILSVFANLPLPLLAVQLLWLNLVTNGIQHVALAFEKGEAEALYRKPRPPEEDVFNPLMMHQTILSGFVMAILAFGLWAVLLSQGWQETSARNLVLLLMVLLENVHVFNCRSELQSAFRVPLGQNWLLLFGVLGAQGLHLSITHLPVMQNVLQVEPINWHDWLWCILLAALLLVPMEIFKLFKRKQENATHHL
jgi:P-type Ca2+ transporter type 2C